MLAQLANKIGMDKIFLSIIIPAYNEEYRISKTLLDIEKCMTLEDYTYEILVVSDGSKDNTAEVVRSLSDRVRNLRVIENKENHGKGWVTRQGILEGCGEWRLFMDADNSTTMREFKKMIPHIKSKFDVIIGSRGIKGAELKPPQPWYRQIPGKIGNLIIQVLVLPGIKDTQCGFKCFSSIASEKIFSVMKIDRWGFDVEALVLAKKNKFKIKEIPVLWINDIHSTVGMSAYISTLIDVVKIRFWLWMGVYDKESKK